MQKFGRKPCSHHCWTGESQTWQSLCSSALCVASWKAGNASYLWFWIIWGDNGKISNVGFDNFGQGTTLLVVFLLSYCIVHVSLPDMCTSPWGPSQVSSQLSKKSWMSFFFLCYLSMFPSHIFAAVWGEVSFICGWKFSFILDFSKLVVWMVHVNQEVLESVLKEHVCLLIFFLLLFCISALFLNLIYLVSYLWWCSSFASHCG